MKKLNSQVAFLQNRLVFKFEQTPEQLNASFLEYLEQERPPDESGAAAENAEKKSSGNQNQNQNQNKSSDMTDDELRELEVLKYKYENGVELIKKEYEQQLDFVNNKVWAYIFFLF